MLSKSRGSYVSILQSPAVFTKTMVQGPTCLANVGVVYSIPCAECPAPTLARQVGPWTILFVNTQCGPFSTATFADIVAMPIHSLAHDQCPPCGIVLGPLHLPYQLEVGRDGGAIMTRPLQIVEHHHIEGVGMVLGEGRRGEIVILLYRQYKWPCVTSPR